MALNSMWEKLDDACQEPDRAGSRLWGWLKEKIDLALYRPKAEAGVEISALTGRAGPYFVLKNPERGTYFQISDRDYFLWEQMDGTRSVKDLVVAYFLEYGAFAFGRIARLVYGLKSNYMLEERPLKIYNQINLQLLRRSIGYRLQQFGSAFMSKPFAIRGVDGVVSWLYRILGWLFYSRPMQIVYILVSVVGIFLFVSAYQAGELRLVAEVNGSYVWGIIALAVILFFAILVHELSHALTVKHYGREVSRAGVMIYLGMPGFFVDTSDIWMEGKRARLAVTWAGPYSGMILSGFAAIIFTLWPGFTLNSVLFRFAFLSYMIVFLNVNPLLKLDGYYLLMDWLEIPNLRRKSFAFLRSGLPAKFSKPARADSAEGEEKHWWDTLASFSREEYIFTIFGLLSALWTVYAVFLGMRLWGARLILVVYDLYRRIKEDPANISLSLVDVLILIISFVFVAMMVFFVWGMLRKALQQAARTGVFRNTWSVAGSLLLASIVVTLAVELYVTESLRRVLSQVIALSALLAAVYFSWRNYKNYRGSRYATFFAWTGFAALVFTLQSVLRMFDLSGLNQSITAEWVLLIPGMLSSLALFIASLSLWKGMDVRHFRNIELVLLGLGLLISFTGVLWIFLIGETTDLEVILGLSGFLLPALALTALIPIFFSHWGRTAAAAWALSMLSLAVYLAVTLLGWPATLFILLFTGSLVQHLLAYDLLPLSSVRPKTELEISDESRLKRVFAWSLNSLLAQTAVVNGTRQTHLLSHQFNHSAELAGWQVRLEQEQLHDNLADRTLVERGGIYAAALNLFLDLIRVQSGEKLTNRMFQNVYDGLPWEEREVASRYIFNQVERAAVLSANFQSIRQDYRSLIKGMPVFATMSDSEIELLLPRFKLERHPQGKRIIRQGESGDKFYIIHRGHVEVTQTDENGVTEVVNQLDRGGYFGELALLRDAPRNATCTAAIPTETLTLSKRDFDQLVKNRFTMRDKLDDSIANAELLRKIPLFAEMDGIQVQHIAAKLHEETYRAGERLITQGDIGEKFYVIKSGRVQVFVTKDGQDQEVVERGPGVYVGEIALLLDVPRTASVKALSEVVALTLHKNDFDQLVNQHLFVSRELERESSRRMSDLSRIAPGAT